MRSPLVIALRKRDLLREGEEALLMSNEVRVLTPEAQLAYLKQNRQMGVFVTLLVGGEYVFFIAGGLFSILVLTATGRMPLGWWQPPVCIAIAAFLTWAVLGLRRAFRDYSGKLPDYETLRADVESTPT